ncbi:epidermal growth factor receptor kinase substrate 8-like protein 3 isoform X2 [Betta splendens]|uniref:Epidermal growth factor receptor kinase substrate 8-like protein 3 isoform X2 n=1 Tax=Betta splendens TaxID=158456 RepID=A0A6P7MI25_BETSP|nr:epidermal growth factor receptor kinase substrate 8-like protein 3 isoform X2 [Betta splendens]
MMTSVECGSFPSYLVTFAHTRCCSTDLTVYLLSLLGITHIIQLLAVDSDLFLYEEVSGVSRRLLRDRIKPPVSSLCFYISRQHKYGRKQPQLSAATNPRMFRSDSPFGNDTSSYAGSVQSNGYSTMDEASSQMSGLSRPSAKSIYRQRKEYAESINKMMDTFQYRVEHLFSCDLDGTELRSVADCVEQLDLLEETGRVWAQSMLLEVRGARLTLSDIETKEELESVALSDVLEMKAVMDGGAFKSLLTVSVKGVRRKNATIFMFSCDDVRADYVQKDLSRALSRRKDASVRNAGVAAANEAVKRNPRSAAAPPEPREQPPVRAASPWEEPRCVLEEDDIDEPQEEEEEEEEEERASTPKYEELPLSNSESRMRPTPAYTELDRTVDILNHTLNDIEIFSGKVAAVVAKNAKKQKKNKKGKVMEDMPSAQEFSACLRLIKFAFNLLGELKGKISSPGAPEFVHSLFSTLGFVVSHCSEDVPPSVVAPLLSPLSIRLMSEEASAEEDRLWQSLGDAWNVPSTQWPEDDEDVPEYTPVFSDGWRPPDATRTPAFSESQRRPSPPPAPMQVATKWKPASPSPQKARSSESEPRRMRVTKDFISRNHRELTIRAGEIVELLDKSKQWWKVRNRSGDEGFVPNNVLEDHDGGSAEVCKRSSTRQLKPKFRTPTAGRTTSLDVLFVNCITWASSQETAGSPVLTKRSKPADVKAWLEDKGFSKITVRCLGVLSGSMLLGMTREELKSVCPEEGGRVFFQLQAVRASMAVRDPASFARAAASH